MLDKYLDIIYSSDILNWSKKRIIANAQNDYELSEEKLSKQIDQARKLKTILTWLKSAFKVVLGIVIYYSFFHNDVTFYDDLFRIILGLIISINLIVKFRENTIMMLVFAMLSLIINYFTDDIFFIGLFVAFLFESNIFSIIKNKVWGTSNSW